MSKSKWKEYAKDLELENEELVETNKKLSRQIKESEYILGYIKTLVIPYKEK